MKKSNLIKIIYFLKFFSDALFAGYLSMYFASFFDIYSFEYALLLGIIPFCALIGNFIWGALSKNVKRNLLIIKIILALETTTMILFTLIGKSFSSLLILTILFGLFNSPCFTLQDGLASSYSKKENTSYPSIRYIGSIGYLFALFIGAKLITIFNNNYTNIFIISFILNILCFILWFFIKPFEDVNELEKTKIKFSEILKNKYFIFYFIAYLLVIGTNNVADSYLFSRMSIVGINSSQYSLFFAIEVFFEIITIFISSKFLKEKHYFLLLKISYIIIFLRCFLFGFNLPLNVLFFFAPLRGLGWGGFLSVHILILRKIVTNKLITKAISILTICLSLVNGIITILGSSIYSQITIQGFYFLLAFLQFIGIIFLCLINFQSIKENNQ